MLVLGCGNQDRGDDGAGPAVARRLRELGVAAIEHAGDMASLLDAWSGHQDVILIDASLSGAPPGTITEWNARSNPIPAHILRTSTHAFGVSEAVELARALRLLPASLIVYGIEGACFDIGAPLSPAVSAAVEKLAVQIASSVG